MPYVNKSIKKNKLKLEIIRHIKYSLKEDVGSGDLTKPFIKKNSFGYAKILSNESAIFCGKPWINEIIKTKKTLKVKWLVEDGEKIKKNTHIFSIYGELYEILSIERVCLNYIQTLSSTATITNSYVQKIQGTNAKIFDTRKTLPGMRLAQKYAVKIGGGSNHREGLYDFPLFKENHIMANNGIKKLLDKIKKKGQINLIQIEVENIEQLKIALSYSVKMILLDNFTIKDVKKALLLCGKNTVLEVSGNITNKNLINYAKLGPLRISIGGLTKNIQAIDFSMLIQG